MKINYDKWGKVFKWVTIPITLFFFAIIIMGIYLGATGQKEFNFSNSPEPADSTEQIRD